MAREAASCRLSMLSGLLCAPGGSAPGGTRTAATEGGTPGGGGNVDVCACASTGGFHAAAGAPAGGAPALHSPGGALGGGPDMQLAEGGGGERATLNQILPKLFGDETSRPLPTRPAQLLVAVSLHTVRTHAGRAVALASWSVFSSPVRSRGPRLCNTHNLRRGYSRDSAGHAHAESGGTQVPQGCLGLKRRVPKAC